MRIKTSTVRIPIGNDTMGGYLARPTEPITGSVILIQEIFGVTPAMRAIADDFAREGQAVLVPDIYWRMEADLDLGNGEDPSQRDIAVEYSRRYDEELGLDDLSAAVEWLAREAAIVSRPAAIGMCLGGRLAVRLAARTSLSCAIALYGVGLDGRKEDIASADCPLQFHFGDQDNHNPMAVIRTVEALVAKRRRDDEFFIYKNAQHAFYNRYRLDRFNAKSHRLAKSRILMFLAGNQ